MEDKWKDPDVWELVVASRQIVLRYSSPCLQQHMTPKQLEAYNNIFDIVNKFVPMIKKE